MSWARREHLGASHLPAESRIRRQLSPGPRAWRPGCGSERRSSGGRVLWAVTVRVHARGCRDWPPASKASDVRSWFPTTWERTGACRKLAGRKGLMMDPAAGSFSSFSQGKGRRQEQEASSEEGVGGGRSENRLFRAGTPGTRATLRIEFHRLLQPSCSERAQKVEGELPISKEDGMNVGFITGIWQCKEPHFLP